MKKQLFILISIILFSCGGSGGDDPIPTSKPSPTPTPTPTNVSPTAPNLVSPDDGLLCTDNPLDFLWDASTDADGDAISYELQVATNSTFTNDLQTKSISNTDTNLTLIKGVAYYWRVRAKDANNYYSSYSSVRKYYTEGEGVSNHLPYAPTLVKPVLNITLIDTSTILEWTASDVDNDPLVYDVYFGNANPPVLVTQDISDTTFNVDLDAGTTYYWKIVVKDDNGGQAIGQIWSFVSQ